ncbi:hypothetical protein [Bowmanella denitrificans]|uniref:hypothetical protein n=1 Tax=Bowmanella denitrificans TaxID=366582 RepID=UPI000C9B1623|nr:hypothetical protein [Bowmanella denitrificans]
MDKAFSDWQRDLCMITLGLFILLTVIEWCWQSNLIVQLNLAVLDSLSLAATPIKELAVWLLPLLGA